MKMDDLLIFITLEKHKKLIEMLQIRADAYAVWKN